MVVWFSRDVLAHALDLHFMSNFSLAHFLVTTETSSALNYIVTFLLLLKNRLINHDSYCENEYIQVC